MSMKLEVDRWDYKEAIRKIDDLLNNIYCTCEENNLKHMPSAEEIVNIIVDTIIGFSKFYVVPS